MSVSLSGRVALVTGASRGIGKGIAEELAQHGALVIALSRLAPESSEAAVFENGGTIVHYACDLGEAGAFAPLAEMIVSRWGRLDILVSNAAIMGPRVNLETLTEEDWQVVFATNVTANWRLIKSLGPLMQASDAPRAVFLTSGSGTRLAPGRGAYAISKAALDAIVRTWAAEAEGTKLRVMLANPGPMRTDMRAAIKPEEDPMSLKTPADLAPKIAAMCAADWTVNGKFYDFPQDRVLTFRGPD